MCSAGSTKRPALFVATYFGELDDALPALARTPVEAIGVDLVAGGVAAVAAVPELADKTARRRRRRRPQRLAHRPRGGAGHAGDAAGIGGRRCGFDVVLDAARAVLAGRRDRPRRRAAQLAGVRRREGRRGRRRCRAACATGRDAIAAEVDASNAAIASRRVRPAAAQRPDPGPHRRRSPRRATTRGPAEDRRAAQNDRLQLPALPTTTIGSYPQTSAIRVARAALRAGRDRRAEYERRMRAEIADVIALQEQLGLDVLVHGEPERNDMVQYFAEQLDGFFATQNGWVQSYGSRCVRPPILYGDVGRPHADDRRVDHLRAVADRQTGQGHADRPRHDPGVVVRARRPAAGRHRQPGGAGDPRRDRRPAGGGHRDHPGRRARAARAAAAAVQGQGRVPARGRSTRSGWPRRGWRTPRRSTPTCATRSSAR